MSTLNKAVRTSRSPLKSAVIGLVAAAALAGSVIPSTAFTTAHAPGGIMENGYRGHGSSFHHHFYRGQPRSARSQGVPAYGPLGYGGLGSGGAALGAGLAGAAASGLLGGAIETAEAEPMEEAVSYCSDRFRSYDPSTGTYLGYDGEEHACP